MIAKESVYRIGRLGKPHGVKGEISFQFSDDIFDRVDADYLVLELDGIMVPFFMEEYRFKNDEVALMKFEGVDSENRARELTGTEVYFPRALAEADESQLSWAEIMGYNVLDAQSGDVVCTLEELDETTVNNLFVVSTPAGNEILIPANNDTIVAIDRKERSITVEIPQGLLEINN